MDDDTKLDDPRHDALRFGKYEVLRDVGGGPMLLGSGSYGRTYKARHLMLDTEVAIKVIRRELTASESTRQKFLREGRALAGLAHDHIALLRYFDCGDDGQLYYAMDYCAGGTLAERVRRRGPRPVGEALEIMRQAASALVAAHAAGIIHRDLKPGNIMLAHAPPPLRVKVIDFGLAQSSGTGATGGRFYGTAQWASPEQLREAPIDGRSDLFSLGLILWFLSEGAAPDPGDTSEVVQRRLDPGGYTHRLPHGLPPEVRRLLGDLLETDPSRRVASAVVLLERLALLCAAHPYQPVAEPDEDAAAADETAEPPALLLEGAGDDRYPRMTRLHRDLAGEWFDVELDDGQGQRIVFVLDEHLAEHPGLRVKVLANLARLRRQPVDALPRFSVCYEANGTLVAEFEGAAGGDLAAWLRLRRKVELRDALGFLVRVATAADDAHACGLPGLGLMAMQVRRDSGGSGGETGGSLSGAAPRLFPLLLAAADLPADSALSADASGSTLVLAAPELACNRVFMLAKLIYRMLSGRETCTAVVHSPGAYIMVSALSEQGNAIVRDALGRNGPSISCLELLGDLAAAQNLSLKTSDSGSTPVPPQTVRLAPSDGSTGFPPVMADKRNASPPAAPALTVPPVKRQPMGLRAAVVWALLSMAVMGIAGVLLLGGNQRKPTPEPETSSFPSFPSIPLLPSPQKPLLSTKPDLWVGAKAGDPRTVDLGGEVKLELCWIPAGTFTMGGSGWNETPHKVTLTKPFWLGRTEVTQRQWENVMGNNPSKFKGKNLPVEQVSWHDASDFCQKLNAMPSSPHGWHFALPTEAQWEYACRAGTSRDDAGNLDEMAWYDSNSDGKTHEVATKKANNWGLVDMHGNVWEWCADWCGGYPAESLIDPTGPNSGSNRVIRGGSWSDDSGYCASSIRFDDNYPAYRDYGIGFRVVLAPGQAEP